VKVNYFECAETALDLQSEHIKNQMKKKADNAGD